MQETLSAPQPGSDLATNPQGKSSVFGEVYNNTKMLFDFNAAVRRASVATIFTMAV